MKVLSIQQPWASLVVHGLKRCELRSWPTAYRGPLAIHAARRFLVGQQRRCLEEPLCSQLASIGIRRLAELPRGGIIGTVTLVDCVPASDVGAGRDDGYNAEFAWLLADPVALAAPIAYVGQLGLCALPAEIVEMLGPSEPERQRGSA